MYCVYTKLEELSTYQFISLLKEVTTDRKVNSAMFLLPAALYLVPSTSQKANRDLHTALLHEWQSPLAHAISWFLAAVTPKLAQFLLVLMLLVNLVY